MPQIRLELLCNIPVVVVVTAVVVDGDRERAMSGFKAKIIIQDFFFLKLII
jgi:hypothetical protein